MHFVTIIPQVVYKLLTVPVSLVYLIGSIWLRFLKLTLVK